MLFRSMSDAYLGVCYSPRDHSTSFACTVWTSMLYRMSISGCFMPQSQMLAVSGSDLAAYLKDKANTQALPLPNHKYICTHILQRSFICFTYHSFSFHLPLSLLSCNLSSHQRDQYPFPWTFFTPDKACQYKHTIMRPTAALRNIRSIRASFERPGAQSFLNSPFTPRTRIILAQRLGWTVAW